MADQTVFNLNKACSWGGGPPIHPDDPFPLKVAKKLMQQEQPIYLRQPDGSYRRLKVGDDYYETDSTTITFTEPIEDDNRVAEDIKAIREEIDGE
jgi:hypothetical protein